MPKSKIEVNNIEVEILALDVLQDFMPKAVKKVQSKAPIDTGEYKKDITFKIEKDNTPNGIVYNKDKGWLSHMLEFGTSNMSPKPHYRPAFSQLEKEYINEMKSVNFKVDSSSK